MDVLEVDGQRSMSYVEQRNASTVLGSVLQGGVNLNVVTRRGDFDLAVDNEERGTLRTTSLTIAELFAPQ
jgi:hypothetical protein